MNVFFMILLIVLYMSILFICNRKIVSLILLRFFTNLPLLKKCIILIVIICYFVGTAFTETLIATGLGGEMAQPVMRAAMEKKGGLLSLEEAKEVS